MLQRDGKSLPIDFKLSSPAKQLLMRATLFAPLLRFCCRLLLLDQRSARVLKVMLNSQAMMHHQACTELACGPCSAILVSLLSSLRYGSPAGLPLVLPVLRHPAAAVVLVRPSVASSCSPAPGLHVRLHPTGGSGRRPSVVLTFNT